MGEETKKDVYLQNAIEYLKNLEGNKGYMICISTLDKDDDGKLNHFDYLGGEFKGDDINSSLAEHEENLSDLVKGREDKKVFVREDKSEEEEIPVDLERDGELPLDEEIPVKEDKK